ncbi:MAG TPA: FHA domain-containing protein [Nocardioidaceae bacterium]|nr:FHA domain-containing protein [Nocardioidaceae bacterium]
MDLTVDADLRFSVDVPGARTVTGHLTGSGTALELRVDDSFVLAGRKDAAAIRGLAEGLAHRGLSIAVIGPSGPLVTLGARPSSWLQRRVTRSKHIRIERGAGLLSLARGRAQTGNVGALPVAELAPPVTMWPPAPTFLRRRRKVTTTHDPLQGGNPRLVMASSQHPGPDERRRVFRLAGEVTTIGSAPDCDIRLPGLEPRHAEVRHDEWDEYVLVRTAPGGTTRVNGAETERALLRTGTGVQVGDWVLSYVREEYADHGRPYGGRIGGELGHQRPQPPQAPRPTTRS